MTKIVVDHGTYYIKYGYSGYNKPLGSVKVNNDKIIKNSVIVDYNKMIDIWDDIFYNKLDINIITTDILLTDTVYGGDVNREKIINIMLNHYNFKRVTIQNQQILALYSTCRDKGLVIDIGYSTTRIVPIYESYILVKGIVMSSFGYHCVDKLGKQLYREKLVNNISKLVIKSIKSTPIDYRRIMLENILLVGGGSKFTGLTQDIVKTIRSIYKTKSKIKIYAPKDRYYISWIGGSVLCSLPDDIWTHNKKLIK